MANKLRVEKVAIAIQKEISDILQNEVGDARIHNHFASILRVHVTGDLRHAKVHVSVYGDDLAKTEFMAGIKSAQGFIRSELSRRLSLRFVPELHFVLDASLEHGAKIFELLNNLKAKGELGE